MHMLRRTSAATVIIGALALSIASTAPASAATLHQASTSDAPPPATSSGPLDTSDPVVAAKIAELEANGEELVGGASAEYTPMDAPSDGTVTPQVFPAGCGLSVLLTQSGLTMRSTNITSCTSVYTTAEMESWMGFWAWLTWDNEVASNTEYSVATSSFTNDYTYSCVNSNNTRFHTETYGELSIGGTNYSAAAYDENDEDVACGTS